MLADMGRTQQGECGSGARMAALGAADVVWVSVPDHVKQAQGEQRSSHIGLLCSCDVFSMRDAADISIALQYLSVSFASLAL